MGRGPTGFNAHTGNTAHLAGKFKKKTTKIPISLKENPVCYCGSETDVEAALSNQDKRGATRKTFLPLLSGQVLNDSREVMEVTQALCLCNRRSLTNTVLDSLIDRHVFCHLVQSFCASAVSKNTLTGNKTPPNWSKSF